MHAVGMFGSSLLFLSCGETGFAASFPAQGVPAALPLIRPGLHCRGTYPVPRPGPAFLSPPDGWPFSPPPSLQVTAGSYPADVQGCHILLSAPGASFGHESFPDRLARLLRVSAPGVRAVATSLFWQSNRRLSGMMGAACWRTPSGLLTTTSGRSVGLMWTSSPWALSWQLAELCRDLPTLP